MTKPSSVCRCRGCNATFYSARSRASHERNDYCKRRIESGFVIWDKLAEDNSRYHLGDGNWGRLSGARTYPSMAEASEGLNSVDCEGVMRHRFQIIARYEAKDLRSQGFGVRTRS